MARSVNTVGYKGYVPVYLTEEHKQAIRANLGKPAELLNKLDRYVQDGYKFSISWDSYNDCLAANLFDTDVRRPTGGFILSAKHTDLVVALSSLVYLHEVIYPDGWSIERQDNSSRVSW